MESSLLSMVDVSTRHNNKTQLFNQSISVAELSQRPGESFQLSEDRTTTEAYHLYHDFLNAFQVRCFILLVDIWKKYYCDQNTN